MMSVQIRTTQGSTHRGFEITVMDEVTETAVSLSGASMSGRMVNLDTGVERNIDGTLALVDAANGVFSWSPSATDVSTAGSFEVQFTATISSKPYRTFRAMLFVEEAI